MKKGLALLIAVVSFVSFSIFMYDGEGWAAATFSTSSGTLHIQVLNVTGDGAYEARLLISEGDGIEFVMQSIIPASQSSLVPAVYNPWIGRMTIPVVWVTYSETGDVEPLEVTLQAVTGSDPLRFKVISIVDINPRGEQGPQGPTGPQGPAGPPGPGSNLSNQVCEEGEFVYGFDENGSILCAFFLDFLN